MVCLIKTDIVQLDPLKYQLQGFYGKGNYTIGAIDDGYGNITSIIAVTTISWDSHDVNFFNDLLRGDASIIDGWSRIDSE